MYANANANSGYARADGEIYSALERAGFKVFSAVVKENRGFFIKFDETSLSLVPGTQEYAMPPDLSQVVHLAERQSAGQDWAPIGPADLHTALTDLQIASGWSSFFSAMYGNRSAFGFYGPYLDAAAATGTETQKIRITPAIDAARSCQLVYTAKWLPITDASSKVMLPDEGTYAMESFASAQLCGASDDTRKDTYNAQGREDLLSFLTWARQRQSMAPSTVATYGP
jgi:hypothetical protein